MSVLIHGLCFHINGDIRLRILQCNDYLDNLTFHIFHVCFIADQLSRGVSDNPSLTATRAETPCHKFVLLLLEWGKIHFHDLCDRDSCWLLIDLYSTKFVKSFKVQGVT